MLLSWECGNNLSQRAYTIVRLNTLVMLIVIFFLFIHFITLLSHTSKIGSSAIIPNLHFLLFANFFHFSTIVALQTFPTPCWLSVFALYLLYITSNITSITQTNMIIIIRTLKKLIILYLQKVYLCSLTRSCTYIICGIHFVIRLYCSNPVIDNA